MFCHASSPLIGVSQGWRPPVSKDWWIGDRIMRSGRIVREKLCLSKLSAVFIQPKALTQLARKDPERLSAAQTALIADINDPDCIHCNSIEQ
jgi:hypothetical protein